MKKYLILLLLPCSLLAQATVTWDAPPNDVERYELYWGEEIDSQANYVSVWGTSHVIEDKWLELDVRYYLFVVARDSAWNVSERAYATFVYGQTTDVFAPKAPTNVKVGMTYPNPFKQTLNIRDGLEVEIHNLLGQSLGIFKGYWNASDYPSGVYFIKNEFGDIERVTLLK